MTLQHPVFDLIFIGGGTAALAGVSEALDRGVRKIALLEKRLQLGGECVINACVHLHTLAKAASCFRTIRKQAPQYGIHVSPPQLDYAVLADKVNCVVSERITGSAADHPDVTVIQGEASFLSPHHIQVNNTVLEGRKIIVATGTQPLIPDIPGLAEAGYWLYPDATHMQTIPDSLVILGGGRIGVEFAQVFCQLGSRVTLIEPRTRILPREELEISFELERVLRQEGITFITGQQIKQVTQNNALKTIVLTSGEILESAAILLATGRSGVSRELNLERAGVAYDANGIRVNDQLQTSQDNIWAIGDVIGPYRYTHVANYQAVMAVQNAVNNANKSVDYRTIPYVIFSEPQVAHIGLTEAQARQQYKSVVAMQARATEPTRFITDSLPEGFAKIIIDGETDQILGGHIIASQAGEMIHLLALAMQNQLAVCQLTNMVYAYPTKMQLIQKTLEPYPHNKSLFIENEQPVLKRIA